MNPIYLSSNLPWENSFGYARAVRTGPLIKLAGTTAVERGQVIGVGNPYEQTKFILNKLKETLTEAGADFSSVIRSKVFVTNLSYVEDVAKAHGECFSTSGPSSTFVEVNTLIDPEMLVEIELTAWVEDPI